MLYTCQTRGRRAGGHARLVWPRAFQHKQDYHFGAFVWFFSIQPFCARLRTTELLVLLVRAVHVLYKIILALGFGPGMRTCSSAGFGAWQQCAQIVLSILSAKLRFMIRATGAEIAFRFTALFRSAHSSRFLVSSSLTPASSSSPLA